MRMDSRVEAERRAREILAKQLVNYDLNSARKSILMTMLNWRRNTSSSNERAFRASKHGLRVLEIGLKLFERERR